MTTDALLEQLRADDIKLGEIKKIAKDIKKDHALAMELWAAGGNHPRLLAVLILDKAELDQDLIDQLVADLDGHELDERMQISEWLLANQLMKSKRTKALLESWQHAAHPLLRRLFWYHEGRLRWLGKIPNDNAEQLLASLETDMQTAEPEVQWAMNFCACQIAMFDQDYRSRCIALAERVGLYRGDPVPRGCAPDYLPDFVEHQLAKQPA